MYQSCICVLQPEPEPSDVHRYTFYGHLSQLDKQFGIESYLYSCHRLLKNMEMEETGLRESPPGSVAVHKTENCEKRFGERIEDCALQGKDRDVDGESEKREECERETLEQQQQEETDVHKKQPDEELDPRIQVTEK